jgi:hypothetical protein
MHFFAILTTALLSTGALAAPAADDSVAKRQTYTPCSGLYGTAQCCATDVLGLADLDCANPPSTPTDADDFSSVCAAIGQRARCCVLPILEQGILCETPAGIDS